MRSRILIALVLPLSFATLGPAFGMTLARGVATPKPAVPSSPEVARWCSELRGAIASLKWNLEPCDGIEWKVGGSSVQGRPLVYAEFGDKQSPNTTLVFTMVHADEITPLYLGLELVKWIKDNPSELGDAHVIIAPLVNPDGFYRRPRTRMNWHGVDINRNFATKDWGARALAAWKGKYRSNPRRFPGNRADSEPETIFQEELIEKVNPQKILSVHAPLNHLDYDGPNYLSLEEFPRQYVQRCLQLRQRLRAVSTGYFPGSLGNYAGHEMGIPTLTLELPTASPRKAEEYWKKFSQGIRVMIHFVVPNYAVREFRVKS